MIKKRLLVRNVHPNPTIAPIGESPMAQLKKENWEVVYRGVHRTTRDKREDMTIE